MKKRFLCGLLATASIAMTIAACSSNDNDSPVDPVNPGKPLNVQLPKDFNWNNDSKLGVYHSKSTASGKNDLTHIALNLITGGGTNQATFDKITDLDKGNHVFNAYYPYSESNGNDPKKVMVNLPIEQLQPENGSDTKTTDYSFFTATQKLSVKDTDVAQSNFSLKNIFAILEFDFTLESPEQKISEITISANNHKLVGDFIVDLTADKVVPEHTSSSSNSVTLKASNQEGNLNANKTKARIVINPSQLEGEKLFVKVKTDDKVIDLEIKAENYLANYIYQVPIIIVSPAEDLNTNGYANSYIVSEANKAYKFDAKVQGNGKTTSKINPKKLNPKKAFLVWESSKEEKGVIANVSLDENGIITFITSDKIGGNALIAVTDGEPTDEFPLGTIIWSWHIWSTNYDVNKEITVKSTTGDKFKFMSTNLGALTVDPDKNGNGLKYQWGRKDPFLKDGFKLDGSEHEGVVHYPKYGWQASTYTADSKDLTVEASIAFPTGFFRSGSGNDFDWSGIGSGIENRNNQLWGNLENNLGKKSIYDPCPVGYRVPPTEAFDNFNSDNGKFINESWEFKAEEGKNIVFSTEPSHLMYTTGAPVGPGRDGKTAYYWTSSTKPRFAKENASSFLIEKTWISDNQTAQRAMGASVRCIRE